MTRKSKRRPQSTNYGDLDDPQEGIKTTLSIVTSSLFHQPAPLTTSLPQNGRVPKLCDYKATVARKIVTAFEERVVDVEMGVVYSPLRLWNSSERRKVNLKDSNFTVRCICYYAIRKVLENYDPDEINYTITKLRRIALDATNMKRSDIAALGKQFYWFNECVSIYNAAAFKSVKGI
eukprot:CAMPEP_0172521676 /NCGR_PEP_ID=MMETSP1066-20121228/292718_1 /TAXON_ID=671091 /ORGANISM="Coscinodiscus wailesii, Strain CCMP2513" /LENGTH=176 /DNA_ID=CAMNT_0013304623 /DNA_START=589 /DNA_END=1119 /DNA_ORIENTATION=+